MIYRITWLILLCFALPVQAERILVVGDSLSAAYGLSTEQGWVSLLQQRLARQGQDWQVINASISGETSAGGLARLSPLLERHQPRIVIIALGSNDGLRGLSLAQLQHNLAQMIELAQQQGARVLLPGMAIPPNYGARYAESFAAIYPALRRQYQLVDTPIMLERVALEQTLMLPDNLHPNAAGQPRILETLWPALQSLL